MQPKAGFGDDVAGNGRRIVGKQDRSSAPLGLVLREPLPTPGDFNALIRRARTTQIPRESEILGLGFGHDPFRNPIHEVKPLLDRVGRTSGFGTTRTSLHVKRTTCARGENFR